MKLLMISGDRSVAAGKAGAFAETLEVLSRSFDRIDVLCPRVRSARIVRSCHGTVFLHPSPWPLWLQPLFIRRAGKQLLRTHRHDVLTVHEYPPFYNGMGARLLLRIVRIPSLLELHHIVGHPRAASFAEWIGRLLTRSYIARHARHFTAVRVVNASVRQTLVSWGVSRTQIAVVPSVYLDHARIHRVAGEPKQYDIVFCGRLVPNKDPLPVLEALTVLPGRTLLVIGDGPLRAVMEERARALGLSERVTFTGWLSSVDAVLRAVASGRLFVMNSRSEGNPRVLVEAMALGLPVVATRVGIAPEILVDGEHGFFSDGTADGIAAAAGMILADPARLASMSERARTVLTRFERTSAIGGYVQCLRDLGAAPHHGRSQ